jgi:hypothetical protein
MCTWYIESVSCYGVQRWVPASIFGTRVGTQTPTRTRAFDSRNARQPVYYSFSACCCATHGWTPFVLYFPSHSPNCRRAVAAPRPTPCTRWTGTCATGQVKLANVLCGATSPLCSRARCCGTRMHTWSLVQAVTACCLFLCCLKWRLALPRIASGSRQGQEALPAVYILVHV